MGVYQSATQTHPAQVKASRTAMINASILSSRSLWKLRLLIRNIRTQAKYDYTRPPDDLDESPYTRPAGLTTPRQVELI